MSDISQVVICITDELPDLQGCKSDFSQESSDVEIVFLYVHIYTYIKQCCFFSLYNNNSPSELLYCILELHVVGLLGSLLPPAGVLADGLCPPSLLLNVLFTVLHHPQVLRRVFWSVIT